MTTRPIVIRTPEVLATCGPVYLFEDAGGRQASASRVGAFYGHELWPDQVELQPAYDWNETLLSKSTGSKQCKCACCRAFRKHRELAKGDR